MSIATYRSEWLPDMIRAEASRRASSLIGAGVVAGIIGGVLLDAFLSIANHTPIVQIWQFIASALVGPVAFSSTQYAVLGFAMHFAISIVWALVFVTLAIGPLPWLARRPIAGGLAYGVIVMAGMSVVLAIAHVAPPGPPSASMLLTSLVAHTVFFGLPIALYTAREVRA